MNQKQIQAEIHMDPENQKMAVDIVAIILENFFKSGLRFWANPFFWVSVVRAILPLLRQLYFKIFKPTQK